MRIDLVESRLGRCYNRRPMGRQWLHAKRAVASQKKTAVVSKLVREIMVAIKMGGPDPEMNARLAAACEKARRNSVSREVIERALKKGAGDDKTQLEHIVFEGYAPHKVPVIVEAMTDNSNRTTPEIRVLFRGGQLGQTGSNKFLFDHVGLVEAHRPEAGVDLEEAAIEAEANEVEALTSEQNDDIPVGATGARFLTDRPEIHAVAQRLAGMGWTIVTSEMGYLAKSFPSLSDEQMEEVGEFLQALDDHDDVHRVWAAVK